MNYWKQIQRTWVTVSIVLLTLYGCTAWKYAEYSWSRCHRGYKPVKMGQITLDRCVTECLLRSYCFAVMYDSLRHLCEFEPQWMTKIPLQPCRNVLYIKRTGMGKAPETCLWYEQSPVDGTCIAECELPKNLRSYAGLQTSDGTLLGWRSRVWCYTDFYREGDRSILCQEDGQFTTVPLCKIKKNNRAIEKPTQQSSTWEDRESSLAVDGNTGTCMHTEHETRPWWTIDLKRRFIIKKVVVFNRDIHPEWFSKVHILAADRTMSNRDLDGRLCAYEPGPFADVKITFVCEQNVKGRYVKIILDKKEHLAMCEVEIYLKALW